MTEKIKSHTKRCQTISCICKSTINSQWLISYDNHKHFPLFHALKIQKSLKPNVFLLVKYRVPENDIADKTSFSESISEILTKS